MQRGIKQKLYIIGNYFNYGLIAWFVLVIRVFSLMFRKTSFKTLEDLINSRA